MRDNREALADEGITLARKIIASSYANTASAEWDEYESAGGAGVSEAVEKWDGKGSWPAFCSTVITRRLMDCRRQITGRRSNDYISTKAKTKTISTEAITYADSGTTVGEAIADRKAEDPLERAAAIEWAQERIKRAKPIEPAKVRAAAFAVIKEADVVEVIEALLKRAKEGDARSARVLFDIIGAKKT